MHPWKPLFDSESRVLVLGTIPSPRSRAEGFYFGHPQNVFWSAIADSLRAPRLPAGAGISEKTALLRENHVALWDVLHSCVIEGASDASVREPVPNKFKGIIEASKISAVFATGKTAVSLFNKYCVTESGMRAIYLPSTSPANRATQMKPAFAESWAGVGRIIRGELVSAAGMKAADAFTIHVRGIPSMTLMENAAGAVCEVIAERCFTGKSAVPPRIVCVCGAGNNGGDGFAVARLMKKKGARAEVVFVGEKAKLTAETSQQWELAAGSGVPVYENDNMRIMSAADGAVIVDAVFGIGLTRNITRGYLDAVRAMEAAKRGGARIVAVDIPSGVSADTGEILGAAAPADFTVTFACNKIGLTAEPGKTAAGTVVVKDIGIAVI